MENINQNNFMEQSTNSKIRTPAALFSKNTVKSPAQNFRTNSMSQAYLSCANHPQKEAVFYTSSEGERLYFCEKCAIKLASQGHSITKVK